MASEDYVKKVRGAVVRVLVRAMPQSGRYTRQTGVNKQKKKQMAPAQMRVIDARED